jgi:predicted enzyme related to lactoylglutathione lyase
MITNVGMIILLEHDLDAAVEFYKKLGLKLVFHIKESWAEFAIGPVKLGLCPTSQVSQDRVTGIVLEVDDIKTMYATLKDTIPFKAEPLEKIHGLMASIQDPGGNIIDLYQPTPHKVQKLVQEMVQKDQWERVEQGDCCASKTCQCKPQGKA